MTGSTREPKIAPAKDESVPSAIAGFKEYVEEDGMRKRMPANYGATDPRITAVLDKYDTNKDGTFSVEEVVAISSDLLGEQKTKKKLTKLVFGLVGVITFMLIANASLTAGIVFLAKDAEVDGSGTMRIKGTNKPIMTAANSEPAPLTSFLPDAAFDKLKFFTATSETGARVHVNVLGWMRIPAGECLPPIVKLNTQAGHIHIEGTTLEFDDKVAPIFLEAGFLTGTHVQATGVGGSRRKLSMSALTGFFDTLEDVKAADPTTCIPTLPSLPKSMHTISKRLVKCTDCDDENGFRIPNLGGVETMNGVMYQMTEEASTRIVGEEDNHVKQHSVTRYSRFPELRHFDVSNGTHSFSWVEFEGAKFHCEYGSGFNIEKSDVEPNDVKPSGDTSRGPMQKELLIPTIRYDGFTWYTSMGRGGDAIPALKYEIEYPSMELKIELFTTVNDPNKALGVQSSEYNHDTMRYELKRYSDYHEIYVDEQLPASLLDDSRFVLPDMSECKPKDNTIHQPPVPSMEPVGPGTIVSPIGDGRWGAQPTGPDPSYVDLDQQYVDEASEDDDFDNTTDTTAIVTDSHGRALKKKGKKCSSCKLNRKYTGANCQTYQLSAGPIEIDIDPCTPKITAKATGGYGPIDISGSMSMDLSYQPPNVEGCIHVAFGCSSLLKKFMGKSADDICGAFNIGDLVEGTGCISSTDQNWAACRHYGAAIPFTPKAAMINVDLCLTAALSFAFAGVSGKACAKYAEVYDYTNKEMGSFIRIDYELKAWVPFDEWKKADLIYPVNKAYGSSACANNVWYLKKRCRSKSNCDASTAYKYLGGKMKYLDPNPGGSSARSYAGYKETSAQFNKRAAAAQARKGRARLL